MPRPRGKRNVAFIPKVTCFKPQGIPAANLAYVEISGEELEAYRLRHEKMLDQRESAEEMCTSPSTYQRILCGACAKIADALLHGKAIRLVP